MIASLMAMLGLSMLHATLNGSRVVNYQGDEYRLTSAVESVGIIATDMLWSGYIADPKKYLRTYLDDKKARSKMTFKLKKEDQRAAVSAYLASLNN